MSKLTTVSEARMQHRNARLTPTGRRQLLTLVDEREMTFEAAAAASKVAKSTVHTWVARWRAASAAERESLACFEDRSSRPRHSPRLLSEADQPRLRGPPAARAGARD